VPLRKLISTGRPGKYFWQVLVHLHLLPSRMREASVGDAELWVSGEGSDPDAGSFPGHLSE